MEPRIHCLVQGHFNRAEASSTALNPVCPIGGWCLKSSVHHIWTILETSAASLSVWAMKDTIRSLRNLVCASNVGLFEASWQQVRKLQTDLPLTLRYWFTFKLPLLWNNFNKSPQSNRQAEGSWGALLSQHKGVKSTVHSCGCVCVWVHARMQVLVWMSWMSFEV